jgi:hypothetical protein
VRPTREINSTARMEPAVVLVLFGIALAVALAVIVFVLM